MVGAIHNFRWLNPNLCRGGRLTPEGARSLADMGIRTVISLEGRGADREREWVEGLGMRFESVPLSRFFAPPLQRVVKLIESLSDPQNHPVYIHCKAGKDRTGMVVACYRIAVEGWTTEDALKEMRECGSNWYAYCLKRAVLKFARAWGRPPGPPEPPPR